MRLGMILKKKINMVTLIVICCTISVRFYGKIVLLYGILHWLSTSETEYKGGADACYSSTVYAQKMRQSRGHAILVYCQDTCLLIDHEEVGQRGLNWNGVSKRDVKCYTKHYWSRIEACTIPLMNCASLSKTNFKTWSDCTATSDLRINLDVPAV